MRAQILHFGAAFTATFWAGLALLTHWHPFIAGGGACIAFLGLALVRTSIPRVRSIGWAVAAAAICVGVAVVLTKVIPGSWVAVGVIGFPFGVMTGLDSGRWWPDREQLTGLLDWFTRCAFLLAGIIALSGARLGVPADEMSSLLTGPYSYGVFAFGAVLLLAALGASVGVPLGALILKTARERPAA